jgi:tRNA threonylcarbamoyladenosine biosynthesis protein TsaE
VRHPHATRVSLIDVRTLTTDGPGATQAVGAALGAHLAAGDVVLLSGALGAGKTVFVQGLARGLGLLGAVKSPTFTLVHEHHARAWPGARVDLAHLDLYRLEDGRVSDLGLDEFLDHGVVVAEWGERLADLYPDHVHVTLASAPDAPGVTADPAADAADASDTRRTLTVAARGERARAVLAAWAGAVHP